MMLEKSNCNCKYYIKNTSFFKICICTRILLHHFFVRFFGLPRVGNEGNGNFKVSTFLSLEFKELSARTVPMS